MIDWLCTVVGQTLTIIGWGFCDIQNNQGQGSGYQLKPKAKTDNPYRDIDYSGYHKTESNHCFTIHWTKQKNSHVFASSLMASKTKWANLTWLPLEIIHHVIHDMITCDLECPWHDYCILSSYDVTGTDFKNSLYTFGQSEKR